MLDLLDSILAFAAIMAGVSMLITVLVQAVGGLLNLRGWILAAGLAELFVQAGIDDEKTKVASKFAKKILTHPLMSDSILGPAFSHWSQASALRKEELLRFLADGANHGLELAPEVAAGLKGKLDHAAKVVNTWFDSQMDRVSQVFVTWTRFITIVVSFIVAFALHLDASYLLERMFSDSETRAKLVAGVSTLEKRAERLGIITSDALDGGVTPDAGANSSVDAGSSDVEDAGTPDAGTADAAKDGGAPKSPDAEQAKLDVKQAADEIQGIRADLAAAGIDIMPKFAKDEVKDGVVIHVAEPNFAKGIHTTFDFWPFDSAAKEGAFPHLLGILAAGALLSLGAPFWFNLLKQLSNLKGIVAKKEEDERKATKADAKAAKG